MEERIKMVPNLLKFSVYTQGNMKRDVGGFKFQRFSTNGPRGWAGRPLGSAAPLWALLGPRFFVWTSKVVG